MSSLALLGGDPVRTQPFPAYRTIDDREVAAVSEVLQSGDLSKFIGADHPSFYGGPRVQAFEQQWAASCDVAHAVSVNSCTSGLYAAVGAAGVAPGDEVIVSPYTMSASATAAIIFNAVPVFADIDPDTYCITAETIAAQLTPRTRAIVVVHIFGQPADMDPIMELAARHDLVVIEDAAQSPFARYDGRPVGSLGHMGVFSLNHHKHIHTGEGGVVTTSDARLAERLQLIRNHAEAVVGGKGIDDLTNMIGFNFRMGEIEAAIATCQMAKAPDLIAARRSNVAYLEAKLRDLPGLRFPDPAHDHVYYLHPIDYDAAAAGAPRDRFVQALKAELPPTEHRESEGPLLGQGYVQPLYLLPMYQKLCAYGSDGFPFVGNGRTAAPNYAKGTCPNAERAHEQRLIHHELMLPSMQETDLDDVVDAFHKVFDNLEALRRTDQDGTS